ncbi:MAG: histidine phosphatase family protein [Candidatus Binatia bacterium]
MERTHLIVVRHGETTWNAEGRWQGHLDSPLTTGGMKQAQALAKRLMNQCFSALYTSDLGRAYQTAQIIAATTGHGLVSDERLRERHLGIFQGLRSEEIKTVYPEEYQVYTSRDPDHAIPGGESLRQQVERNIGCLEELARRHLGESIVVVTHGGVLGGLFRHTLSIPFQAPRRFEFMNASFNVFTYGERYWTVQTWGDVSHLDADMD